MRKVLLFATLLSSSLVALNIDLEKITILNEHKDSFKDSLPKYIKIDDKESYRVLNENLLFAKRYLREHNISIKDRAEIERFMIDYFANRYKRELFKNYSVDEKVLREFFKKNSSKYQDRVKYSFEILKFDSFQRALNFSKDENLSLVTEVKEFKEIEQLKLTPNLIKIFSDLKLESYSNPIYIDSTQTHIYRLISVDTPEIKKFEDVKERVREDYLYKIRYKIFDEALK
jgi:hypothetical protein